MVFALIMAYIWRFRAIYPWSWTLILALILLSHALRGERPAALGFRRAGFTACCRRYAAPVAGAAAILLAAAFASGTLRPMTARGIALSLGLYVPWGIFQEYLLNGYMFRRLAGALAPAKASVTAAALFSLAHLPNWPLMLATLAGGLCAIAAYRRYRNLYFLGLAHAVLGFALFAAAPDRLIHHLRVGPGWYRP